MRKSRLLCAVCASLFTFITISSHAALISRLGGLAYYDDLQDITWLTDANYAATELTDARIAEIVANTPTFPDGHVLTTSDFTNTLCPTCTGSMTWWGSVAWADQLTFGGYTNWRLPSAFNSDGDSDAFI